MKPRGTLMIEHRLIEKILSVVKRQIDIIGRQDCIEQVFRVH